MGRVAGASYPTEVHVGTVKAGMEAKPDFTWVSATGFSTLWAPHLKPSH